MGADSKMSDCQTLLGRLRRGDLSRKETIRALNVFGEQGFVEAEPDVGALLNSQDSQLRYYALSILLRDWKPSSYKGVAERVLQSDSSDDVRIAAVFGLGALGLAHGDRSVLRPLYQALMNKREKSAVRVEAYNFIRMIYGEPILQRRLSKFSDIRDWGTIEEVRNELESNDQEDHQK